ncbi:unnamed protein product [Clonostachys rosea f. rosea IK726]|uniref:Uncharacterized protein n=1 Tax=Clonostachys rosea f. rosea IK726 TaxID=1349383 RepID=A0ACA9T7E5_BIOOC|nr:unnamed protein product [Clonostachys rosea f. rosea IK726]
MARDFTIPVSGLQVLMQDADEKLETRQYKKRKTHPKSRGGCGSCKLKRVKNPPETASLATTGLKQVNCDQLTVFWGRNSAMRPSQHVNAAYELVQNASTETQMAPPTNPWKTRNRILVLYRYMLAEN